MALCQNIDRERAMTAASVEATRLPMALRLKGSAPPSFSALEEQVIALARHDPLGSLERPGGVERLVAWAFGIRASGRTLADSRLEALRRAVVVTRFRRHLPDAVAAELRGSGWAPRQVLAIEARALS